MRPERFDHPRLTLFVGGVAVRSKFFNLCPEVNKETGRFDEAGAVPSI